MPDAASPDDSTVTTDPVERFALAWQAGERPDLDQYLRALPPPAQELAAELVAVDLQHRLRAGDNVRVEDYLGRYPGLEEVAGLVPRLVEAECRRRQEQALAMLRAEYLRRFPRHEAQLRLSWAGRADDRPRQPAPLRYRPERLHAQGGLGEVWVAQDQELHRDVALKLIQARYQHHAESRRRFLLEAEITGRLEHPGVVPVYGLHQGEDGQLCYAMRFIHGQTLQEAIAHFHDAGGPSADPGERSVAFRGLLGRFVAVCNAVGYAHSRGILHRDLKPANIMLGKYGETLVVDWGLSKALGHREAACASGEDTLAPSGESGEGSTQAGCVLGTPAYMSPEQAAGRWQALGPASDVCSLGATLYALLTGRAPFEGRSDEILAQVQAGQFPSPGQVRRDTPRPLAAVCKKAMALRPEDRYATALELAAEVERWLADEPVLARRETVLEKLQRGCRRRPGFAALFVLFGVADLSLLGSLAASAVRSGAPGEMGMTGVLFLVVSCLLAILLMQGLALVGGLIGGAAGVVRRLVRGAPATRPGAWALFGARCGLVAGFPLGAVAMWAYFNSTLWGEGTMQDIPGLAIWFRTALVVGVVGPLLGASVGTWTARGRGWLKGLATGAVIGSLLSLIAGCLIGTVAMQHAQAAVVPEHAPNVLRYSADGRRMVTGSRKGQITAWDAGTGKALWQVDGHPGSNVTQAVFSADGGRIASVAEGDRVRVWDARNGEPIVTLHSDGKSSVRALAFSTGGKHLAGASWKGTVLVWDLQTGQEVRSLTTQPGPLLVVAFSPDGKRLATFGRGGMQVVNDVWGR